MKYVKFIMVLTVCSSVDCLLIPQAANADSIGPKTAHAYVSVSEDFCAEGAKNKMERLNSLTENSVAKIEELKHNINELEAKKNIIKGIQQIKGEYLDALNAINSESDIKKTTATVKKQSIDQFKKLLNKSLTLNAISLLVKDDFNNLNNAKSMQELCNPKNPFSEKNSKLLFCSRYGEQGNWLGSASESEVQGVKETLNHFLEALSQINDKQSANVDVSNILASIPEGVRPSEILEIFNRQSPLMTQALAGAKSSERIMACLEGSDQTCEAILNKQNREGVQSLIKQEMADAQNAISGKIATLNQSIDFKNTKDLEAILHTFDNPLEAREKGNHELLKTQLNNVQTYSLGLIKNNDALFKSRYPESITNNNGFKLIGVNDEEYNGFVDQCSIPSEAKGKDLTEKVDGCKAIIEKLSDKANEAQRKMENDIQLQKTELAKLLDDSGKLSKIEKIKQYVIQRYIRSCPQAKSGTLTSNISNIRCMDQDLLAEGETDEIGSLAKSLSNAVGRLQSGNKTNDQKGELGIFSKDELKVYMNQCQNMIQDDPIFKESCQQINQYYAEIANQKESKEWDEFNHKYWVEYDPKEKKGYSVYEKKSNLRILGEGLSQSMNGIYPLMFGNMAMDGQIQMMTNQAMYQKQMMYMNSFNSPWMNQTYFQGSYFPAMPTVPTSQGFNFGP